ncbi:uncharacterized protein LOC112051269 [Bicyclus anynana]|uniref:Uncharacterized protein LOC112051269 n=1 Tax=Bicyclus anynana TaxID=110368 RepID=A0A6J1NL02_BICAN|nr:uncharacterized protein LOC112051269 [Bicyclus anynana]
MSHFGDFMDGVPVKISEKYKRPPRIELPYSVSECPLRAQNFVESVKYCSTFERNVLSKLRELRSAKETKKNERRHRLQLLEEAKQKKLDAIAVAEAEERLKQLSVSEVSYPSTDEISALSPDDRPDKACETCPVHNTSPEVDKSVTTDIEYLHSSAQSEPNILQPIQVQSNYQQSNLLDDPDPLQEFKNQTKIMKYPQYSNMDALTFKDFENDTSSPFDNVELKTINDMELLAQVLQSQRGSVASCQAPNYNQEELYPGYTNCATQAQVEGVTYLPNAYVEQQIQGPNVIYAPQPPYPVSNGYYIQDNVCDNVPMENMYVPNYQYYVPTQYPGPSIPYQQYNHLPTTSAEIQAQNGSYIPQPYYYQYPQVPAPYITNTFTQVPEIKDQEDIPPVSSQTTVKSRSRSVPDIVKELNDELVSAHQRANERSYNASPAPVNVPRSSSHSDKKEERRKRRIEKLPNPYDKFPTKLQNMCQQIHSMGFPLDRVARVCSLVGENHKKVIECLLILGELMDLGFSEGRVSAALAKHEFNRDKALDELVS